MSSSIDERVVEMKFDNGEFEKGVKETIASLNRLNDTIEKGSSAQGTKMLENLSSGLDDLNKKTQELPGTLDTVSRKFSALGTIGDQVLRNLTSGAMNVGRQMIAAINKPWQQIKTGGWSRAMNLDQAEFQIKGLGMSWKTVNRAMQYAVNETAYGLDAAAQAAGILATSGVNVSDKIKLATTDVADLNEQIAGLNATQKKAENLVKNGWLDDMSVALRAISGVAAQSGSDYSTIANIFEDAAGVGKVSGDTLNRLAYQGINATSTLGKALGKSNEEIKDMVSKGKISFQEFSNIMYDTFAEHAIEANNTFTGALANVKAALSKIGAEVVSNYLDQMPKLLNAVRLSINKVKQSLTDLGVFKTINDTVTKVIDTFTKIVNKFKDSSIIENTIETITNLCKGLYSIVKPLGGAMMNLFPPVTIDSIETFSEKLKNLSSQFGITDEKARQFEASISRTFEKLKQPFLPGGILNSAGIMVKKIFGGIGSTIKSTIDNISNLQGVKNLKFAIEELKRTKITPFLSRISKQFATFARNFKFKIPSFDGLLSVIDKISNKLALFIYNISHGKKKVTDAVNDVNKSFKDKLLNGLDTAAGPLAKIKQLFINIGTIIKDAFYNLKTISMKDIFTSIGNGFSKFGEKVKTVFSAIKDGVDAFAASLKAGFDKTSSIFGGGEKAVKKFGESTGKDTDKVKKNTSTALGTASEYFAKFNTSLGQWLGQIGGVLVGIGGGFVSIMKPFANGLQLIGDALKGYNEIDPQRLLKIAAAIGILAASLFALATIPTEKLKGAVLALTLIFGMLGTALVVLNKINSVENGIAEMFSGGKNGKIDYKKGFLGGILGIGKNLANAEAYEIQMEALGNAIIKFAAAIAIVSAAVYALAQTNPTNLLAALASVLLIIMAIFKVMEQMGSIADMLEKGIFGKMAGIGTGMLIFAAAVKVVADAALQLAAMSPEQMAIGMSSLLVSIGALVTALSNMATTINGLKGGSAQLIAAGASMILVATSMRILASAVTSLSGMNLEEMATGMSSMLVGLGAMVTALKNMTSVLNSFTGGTGQLIAAAGSLIIVATALKILSSAVLQLSEMNIDQMAMGMGSMLVSLGAMVAALQNLAVISNTLSGSGKLMASAVSLIFVATALNIMAGAIKSLGDLTSDQLTNGLSGIGVGLVELSFGLYAMKDSLGGAVALTVASVGVLALAKAIKMIQDSGGIEALLPFAGALMSLALALYAMNGSIVGAATLTVASIGILALAKALQMVSKIEGGLGAVATFAGGLMILALALFTMNASIVGAATLSVASIGMLALAKALQTLSGVDGGLGAVATFAGGLMDLALGLFALNASITGAAALSIASVGITALAGAMNMISTIPNGLDIFQNFGTMLTGLADGLFKMNFASAGAGNLEKAASGITMLGGALSAWGDVSGTKAAAIGDAIKSIASGVFMLTLSGSGFLQLNLLGSGLKSLASGMQAFQSVSLESVSGLGDILKNLAGGLFALGFTGNGTGYLSFLASGLQTMAGALQALNGINLTSVQNIFNVISAITTSMPTDTSALSNVASVFSTLSSSLSSIEGVATTVTTALQNVVNAAINTANTVSAQFQTIGLNMAQGMANGILSGQGQVVSAINNVANAAVNAARAALGVHSPSVIMAAIGGFVTAGLAAGILSKASLPAQAMTVAAKQVENAARDTLGVHSNSQVMIGIGEYTDGGLAEGISNNADAPKKAMGDVCADLPGIVMNKLDEGLKKFGSWFVQGNKEIAETATSAVSNVTNTLTSGIALGGIDVNSELEKATSQAQSTMEAAEQEALNSAQQTYNNIQRIWSSMPMLGYNDVALQKRDARNEQAMGLGIKKKEIQEDPMKKAQEEMEKSMKSMKSLGNASDGASSGLGKVGKSADGAGSSASKAADDVDKLKDSLDFFSSFDPQISSKISPEKMLSNFRSQAIGLKTFYQSLTALAAKGIDKGIIQSFVDEGISAYPKVSGMLEATREQVQQLNSAWNSREAIAAQAQQMAQVALTTSDEITRLQAVDAQRQHSVDVANAAYSQYQSIANGIIAKGGNVAAELQNSNSEAAQSWNQFVAAAQNAGYTIDDVNKLIASGASGFEHQKDAVLAATEAYQEAAEAIAKFNDIGLTISQTMESQYESAIGWFDKFDNEFDMGIDELMENVQSQLDGLAQYNDNINKIIQKGGGEMVALFGDKITPEIANALAQGSDDQIATIQDQLKTLQNLPFQYAQQNQQTWFEYGKVGGLGYQEALNQLATSGSFLGIATNIGQNVAQGLANGMTDTSAVITNGTTLGTAAVDAVATGAQTHSPSAFTTDVGVNIVQGLINGMGQTDGIAAVAQNLGTLAVNNVALGVTNATSIFNSLSMSIVEQIRTALSTTLAGTDYATMFMPVVNQVLSQLAEPATTAIMEWMSTSLPGILEQLRTALIEQLTTNIGENLLGLLTQLQEPLTTALTGWVTTALPGILTMLQEPIITALTSWISESFVAFLTLLQEPITAALTDWISNSLSALLAAIQEPMISSITTWVSSFVPTLLNGIQQTVMTAIVTWFNNMLTMLANQLQPVIVNWFNTTLTTVINSAIDQFLETEGQYIIEQSQSKTDTIFKQLTEYIKEKIDELNEAIKGSIEEKFKEIDELLKAKIEECINVLKDTQGDWVEAGKYLVEGFAQGIRENSHLATEAATEVGSEAAEALRASVDEHSPSKLTHKYGVYFSQGFAEGIGAGTGAAVKAASNLGSSAVDALGKSIDKVDMRLGDSVKHAFGKYATILRSSFSDNAIDVSTTMTKLAKNSENKVQKLIDKTLGKWRKARDVYNHWAKLSSNLNDMILEKQFNSLVENGSTKYSESIEKEYEKESDLYSKNAELAKKYFDKMSERLEKYTKRLKTMIEFHMDAIPVMQEFANSFGNIYGAISGTNPMTNAGKAFSSLLYDVYKDSGGMDDLVGDVSEEGYLLEDIADKIREAFVSAFSEIESKIVEAIDYTKEFSLDTAETFSMKTLFNNAESYMQGYWNMGMKLRSLAERGLSDDLVKLWGSDPDQYASMINSLYKASSADIQKYVKYENEKQNVGFDYAVNLFTARLESREISKIKDLDQIRETYGAVADDAKDVYNASKKLKNTQYNTLAKEFASFAKQAKEFSFDGKPGHPLGDFSGDEGLVNSFRQLISNAKEAGISIEDLTNQITGNTNNISKEVLAAISEVAASYDDFASDFTSDNEQMKAKIDEVKAKCKELGVNFNLLGRDLMALDFKSQFEVLADNLANAQSKLEEFGTAAKSVGESTKSAIESMLGNNLFDEFNPDEFSVDDAIWNAGQRLAASEHIPDYIQEILRKAGGQSTDALLEQLSKKGVMAYKAVSETTSYKVQELAAYAEEAKEAADQNAEIAKKHFEELGGVGGQTFAQLKQSVEEATTAMNEFSNVIQSLYQEAAQGAPESAFDLEKIVDDTAKIKYNLSGLGSESGGVIGSEFGENWADGFLNKVSGSSATIAEQLSKALNGAAMINSSGIGTNYVDGINDGITERTPQLTTVATGLGNLILTNTNESLGIHSPSVKGMEIGQYFVEGIGQGISGNTSIITDAVNSLVSQMIPIVTNTLLGSGMLVTALQNLAVGIQPYLPQIFIYCIQEYGPTLLENITQSLVDVLTGWMTDILAPQLIDAFTNLFNTIFDQLKEELNPLFEDAAQKIIDIFNKDISPDQGRQIGYDFGKGIADGIGEVIEEIRSKCQEIIDLLQQVIDQASNMASTVSSAIQQAISEAQGAGDAIRSAISGATSGVSTAASGVMSSAIGSMNSAGGINSPSKKTYQTGMYLMQGLRNGITENAGIVSQSGANAMYGTINSINNAGGVHSPSTVMMETGSYLMQGLALGISQNTNTVADNLRDAMNTAYDVLTGDSLTEPVISPVLDLTDLNSRVLDMKSTLSGANGLMLGADLGNFMTPNQVMASRNVVATIQGKGDIIGAIGDLTAQVNSLGNKVNNLQVVLDSGTLVGEITPQMNAELGKMYRRQARG